MSVKDVLSMQFEEVEPAEPIPTGKWLFKIYDAGATRAQRDKPGQAWFRCLPLQATDDVDYQEYEAYLNGEELDDKEPVFHSIQLRGQNDAFKVKQFLEAIGVTSEGSLLDAIKESADLKFYATVLHAPAKNPDSPPWIRLVGVEAGPDEDDEAE